MYRVGLSLTISLVVLSSLKLGTLAVVVRGKNDLILKIEDVFFSITSQNLCKIEEFKAFQAKTSKSASLDEKLSFV